MAHVTPREKQHMGMTLLGALGLKEEKSLATLDVPAEVMARAVAFEGRLFDALKRFGLRGGEMGDSAFYSSPPTGSLREPPPPQGGRSAALRRRVG